MPTTYMRNVSRTNNRRDNQRLRVSEAKFDDDRRRADRVVTIAIPMPKSEVVDIDNAIAWDWILGERE